HKAIYLWSRSILGPIYINPDSQAYFDWVPGPETTGIGEVFVIKMPDSVVVRKPGTLTLEKVLTGIFPNGDSFWVYFCG
ncbi:MAG: hypothetical protein N2323_06845, partial [candidate division WOR-3 bacterium]|nr:hypothetical protein [candidate division WOR-3 bacterium]